MLAVRAGAVLAFGNSVQHVRDAREFYAWTTLRLAAFDLGLVEYLPVGVGHDLWLASLQQLEHRLRVACGGARQGRRIRQQQVDGFLRVLLVGTDHPFGAALDPAYRVLAGNRLFRLRVDDTTIDVWDDASALVEGHAGQGQALVAHSTEQQVAGKCLE